MNILLPPPDLTEEQVKAKLDALRADMLRLMKERGVVGAVTLADATRQACCTFSFAHVDAPWSLTHLTDNVGGDDAKAFKHFLEVMQGLSPEQAHVHTELTKKMYMSLLAGMKECGMHLAGMAMVMGALLKAYEAGPFDEAQEDEPKPPEQPTAH